MDEKMSNEEVPPQGVNVPQVQQVPIANEGTEVSIIPPYMINKDIRGALLYLDGAMTTQVNNDLGPVMDSLVSTLTSRLRDFVRINPSTFIGTMLGEDPQEFLDGLYKLLSDMVVNFMEKAEFDSQELREVAQVS